MNKKKIAVIGLKGLPAFGGAAAVGENIIEQLKDKYEFTVYSVKPYTELKTGEYNGFYQIVFKRINNKKVNSLVYYLKSAIHAVFLGSYDVIHLHHRDASFIIPFLKIRYKVILTTHGMVLTSKWSKFQFFFNLQDNLFLKYANIISTVSFKDQRIIKQILPLKETFYIPNGVNILKVVKLKKNHIMFAAGRIVHSKGCDLLLKSLNSINYKGKIIIAGDLNQNKIYKQELLELSSSLNVVFKGLIKNKDTLDKLINNSFLFVYPSSIESMSMMMLEVVALKTPMICSSIPENRDIFNDREVLFFNNKSYVDLADRIIWAISNPELMNKKAICAFNKLKENYTWNKIAKQYSKLYNNLIDYEK